MTGTCFRLPRARGAREAGFFSRVDFVSRDGSNEVSDTPAWVREAGFPPDARTHATRTDITALDIKMAPV